MFKDLFALVLSRCNREAMRSMDLPNIDSTTMTLGENRLKWAVFHGKRSGIKLYVAYSNADRLSI